jgi:hypothetical protein
VFLWSRWGIAAVPLVLLGLVTGHVIYSLLQETGFVSHSRYWEHIFDGIGWIIGGGYLWLFDRYVLTRRLDKPRLVDMTVSLDQPQRLADGTVQTHIQTRTQVTPRSTFFFIPFKYLWIVSAALGGAIIAANVVGLAR